MQNILIVEDEAKMQRLLQLSLAEEGYTTRSASDAEQGLRLLRQEKFDLVITDLKLPGMDGLEFLQAVKRTDARIPVILMTAFGTVETAVQAMKAGASDYVLKPFSLEEIKLIIQRELNVLRLQEESQSAGSLGEALSVQKYHRAQRQNAGGVGRGGSCGPYQLHGSAGGRKRCGQGPDRASYPPAFPTLLRTFHQD